MGGNPLVPQAAPVYGANGTGMAPQNAMPNPYA